MGGLSTRCTEWVLTGRIHAIGAMPDHNASDNIRRGCCPFRYDMSKPTIPGGAGGAAEGRDEGLRRSNVGGNQGFAFVDNRLVEARPSASGLIDNVSRNPIAHRVVGPAFVPARGPLNA